MLPEPKRRVRWLTHEVANRLISELPEHLIPIVRFSLETGLRQANATGLQWQQVDINRTCAWIHPDQAKAREAIAVPLSPNAIKIIQDQIGRNKEYIFTYQGKPVRQVNTRAWRNALNVPELKTSVGTIYATLGQAGTYNREHHFMYYKN